MFLAPRPVARLGLLLLFLLVAGRLVVGAARVVGRVAAAVAAATASATATAASSAAATATSSAAPIVAASAVTRESAWLDSTPPTGIGATTAVEVVVGHGRARGGTVVRPADGGGGEWGDYSTAHSSK